MYKNEIDNMATFCTYFTFCIWFTALSLAFQSWQITKKLPAKQTQVLPIYISGGVAARLWLR
jgi:hypothetical protein